jgi:hypothetical protein
LTIQVEYSFCRIRLPATGLTLPWQLVAAQEPGPIYLTGSPLESVEATFVGWSGPFFAAVVRTAEASGRRSAAHSVARSQLDWGTILIRNDG